MKITASGTLLFVVFLGLLGFLFLAQEYLLAAHIDGSAIYFSSDGPEYYRNYIDTYQSADILESWEVFLRASPILWLILTDGHLLPIHLLNLAIMFLAMRAALSCLETFQGRMIFLLCSFTFPYYILGFLSLNKEVYAMCAALFYVSYIIRGRMTHLVLAFLLALLARYYMVASLLMLIVTVPRTGRSPRWLLILAALLVVSAVAPMVKALVPQYSSKGLLEDSGATAVLLDNIVSNYGYFLLYPFKYLLLLITRPFSLLSGNTHDTIGAIVSLWSLVALGVVLWLSFSGKKLDPMVRRLIGAGLVAPIPMMWSEIMHWRYHSYVFFFFLFAIVLQMEKDRRSRLAAEPDIPVGQPMPAVGALYSQIEGR